MEQERPADGGADALATRANNLYWQSERSVGSIAEDLDVARGTLYGMIQPLPTGLPCPECTTDMVYANRTARDRRLLACSGCGLVEDEELIRLAWKETSDGGNTFAAAGAGGARSLTAPSSSAGGRALLGLAALAAAAGLTMAFWLRRR